MGRETAFGCASRGDDLILWDIDEVPLSRTSQEIRDNYDVSVAELAFDVTDRDGVFRAYDIARSTVGQATAAIVCAGIHELVSVEDIRDEAFDRMMAVNCKAPLWVAQAIIPDMKSGSGGSITFVSSVSGVRGHPVSRDGSGGSAHYAASKGGLNSLARSMAKELGRFGIRVNCVAPGMIATEMNTRSYDESKVAEYCSTLPLGRIGQVEEIASTLLFLSSDGASYVTGQVLNVCGGSLTA